MSVTNTPRKAGPYTGNNTGVQYTFGFKVFADSDLVVTRAVIATGAESTLVLTTDYSVTRNADQDNAPGGYITLTAALADTYTLTLTSAVPDTQPAVFTNLGGFFPAVLNNALDRLTILVQQLKETVSRSLKVAVSTPPGFNAGLPAPVPYGVLGFNASATGFAVTDPSGSSALARDLATAAGAGMQGYGVSNSYGDNTTGKKLQEFKSAYDYGARGVSTVTDTAAINTGIAAIHTAGGGYLIINEFISTSIDLTTLTNQTDVMLIDRRYKSAGHIAHFSTHGDMEQRIHGASVAGGEGPSWVSVNTATTGDRTSSLVSRYGTGIGSSVAMYMHMGVWDGSNWFPEFDMITNGASGFRSNLRVGYGTVGINTGVTGAYNYTQNKIFTVNKPPALGGGALYELSTTAGVTYGDIKSAATNSALRLAAAGGTNEWSLLSQFPSAGQLCIYDHNTTSNKLVFTSGGDTAITGIFKNSADNVSNLGTAALRWATVYAGTGAINTSDAREKQQVRTLSDAEKAAAIRCKSLVRAFKFNDAVAKKGSAARIHFGVMAQDVKAAFEAEGLDPFSYAVLCYDEWGDEFVSHPAEYRDSDMLGPDEQLIKVLIKDAWTEKTLPAGNRYGVRYDELMAFIISAI